MKFLLVVGVLIAAAWFYFKPLPPGKGPVATQAMRTASGVVGALESYKSNKGTYPFTMDEMVPEFMGSVPRLKGGATLEYSRIGADYKLQFSYTNPLPVHCSHEGKETKSWNCEWL